MLSTRDLIYIPDYRFPDGTIRNKYAIIVSSDHELIVLTLTTSKKNYIDLGLIPEKTSGITREWDRIFFFKKGECVCENGFCFPADTLVKFPRNVIDYDPGNFFKDYPEEDIEIKGCLTKEVYYEFIYCLSKSGHVPKKHKDFIYDMLTQLAEELSN